MSGDDRETSEAAEDSEFIFPLWEEVEHLAPSHEEVAKLFGRKQPPESRIVGIRYFIGTRLHPAFAAHLQEQIDNTKNLQKHLAKIRSAIGAFKNASLAIEAMPGHAKDLRNWRQVDKLLRGMRQDMDFILPMLSYAPPDLEWRIIAKTALNLVVDPALQAAGVSYKATSEKSVRTRLLSYVVRACGISESLASPVAIRDWLKGEEMRLSDFLAYRRTGT